MGFILFLVAFILTGFVSILSLIITPVYYIITFKWKSGFKQLNKWFYKMALAIDQFGNVSCSTTLQICLTKKSKGQPPYPFGDEDDTVSYILGRNTRRGTLTKVGKVIVWILNSLDTNHVNAAIRMKIHRDGEAFWRTSNEDYWENRKVK
jgi:hypothetical protein